MQRQRALDFFDFPKGSSSINSTGQTQMWNHKERKTVANLSSDDLKNTSHGAESADKRYLQRGAAFLPGQRTSTDCTGLDD